MTELVADAMRDAVHEVRPDDSSPRRRTGVIVLPEPGTRVNDAGLAEVVGWAGAATVANRRARGGSLPKASRIGRTWWFSGEAIAEWIDSGAAAEPTSPRRCEVCRRTFANDRGIAVHRNRTGHGADPSS